jgi:hypothetical protein
MNADKRGQELQLFLSNPHLPAPGSLGKGGIVPIGAAVPITCLVRLLVFVFLEVPLLALVRIAGTVALGLEYTLLVRFVLRIIRSLSLSLVLEKWSRNSLDRASTDTEHYRHNPSVMFRIHFHKSRPFSFGAVRSTPMAVNAVLANWPHESAFDRLRGHKLPIPRRPGCGLF